MCASVSELLRGLNPDMDSSNHWWPEWREKIPPQLGRPVHRQRCEEVIRERRARGSSREVY